MENMPCTCNSIYCHVMNLLCFCVVQPFQCRETETHSHLQAYPQPRRPFLSLTFKASGMLHNVYTAMSLSAIYGTEYIKDLLYSLPFVQCFKALENNTLPNFGLFLLCEPTKIPSAVYLCGHTPFCL